MVWHKRFLAVISQNSQFPSTAADSFAVQAADATSSTMNPEFHPAVLSLNLQSREQPRALGRTEQSGPAE